MQFSNIDFTNPILIGGIVAAVLLIIAGIAIAVHQRRRKSESLRLRFGSEYETVLREQGVRSRAEARLIERVRRVERYQLRDLAPAERERFLAQWDAVQSRFIDHPRGAVTEADELVNAVMLARGFPAAEFDQRVADVSVHHARAVESYRSANAIALRAGRNEATTEELRTAMIHYRSLFDELLQAPSSAAIQAELPAETPLRRTA